MKTLYPLRSFSRALSGHEENQNDSSLILAYKRFLADDEFNLEDLQLFRQAFGSSEDAQTRSRHH